MQRRRQTLFHDRRLCAIPRVRLRRRCHLRFLSYRRRVYLNAIRDIRLRENKLVTLGTQKLIATIATTLRTLIHTTYILSILAYQHKVKCLREFCLHGTMTERSD